MITIKAYKYSATATDYKGEELTSYILQGMQDTEKLNQELDVTELTLQGYTTRETFTPEYKIIIEIYQDGTLVNTLHRVVQQDTVSQPIISNNSYFNHVLTLTEPSVVAQKRLVDNISCTYKLQDVTLEKVVGYNLSRQVEITNNNVRPTPPDTWGKFWTCIETHNYLFLGSNHEINSEKTEVLYGKYFNWTGGRYRETPTFTLSNHDGSYTTTELYYNNISNFLYNGEYKGKFKIPIPVISWGIFYEHRNDYTKLGYASVDWKIVETDESGNETIYSGEKISNSNLNDKYCTIGVGNNELPYNSIILNASSELKQEWLLEQTLQGNQYLDTRYVDWDSSTSFVSSASANNYPEFYFKKYTDVSAGIDLSLDANQYTNEITLHEGCSYEVSVSIHNFNDALPQINDFGPYKKNLVGFTFSSHAHVYTGTLPSRACKYVRYRPYGGYTLYWEDFTSFDYPTSYVDSDNISASTKFVIYGTQTLQTSFSHGVPYSALTLIQKAILNSAIINKTNGVSSNNINYIDENDTYAYNCPFYIDNGFITELSSTQINENFYNQKNLWEILVEIGYYIHAIPNIKFGENDKFMITFDRLGETDEKTDNAQRATILNFRGVDDYISATSSYITNMVQLGGQIEEYVAPKTDSEDCLIYNYTVNIQTTKPIIELLHIYAIPITNQTFLSYTVGETTYTPTSLTAGTPYEITKFVYERNIYNLLSITKTDIPNKGISLYYDLGDTAINGCSYQLPQSSTTAYSDYAIKKILFLAEENNNISSAYQLGEGATGPWVNVKVNNFVFKIIYRTKDDVRQEHTRPDLRKYLLNSTFDKVPKHGQFNNQTDTLVDSVAFGSQMFGKLVRTGNNEFTITDWVSNANNLKHKGELYLIDSDRYYVSKVTNIYYADHIESTTEYSKDFNQLSQIVGIPSEPRFYEISEQSSIRRDINIDDYLLATTDNSKIETTKASSTTGYLIDMSHLKDLTLGTSTSFAKYAITTFKGDKDIANEGNFGEKSLYKDILLPINAYSSGGTLTYEWDTLDNFGAGDKSSKDIAFTGGSTETENAYRSLRATQYCDKYGKATLMDFYIINDISPTAEQVLAFPESPIDTSFDMSGKSVLASNRLSAYAQGVSLTVATFGTKISHADGTYNFIYDGTNWKIITTTAQTTITLSEYGISILSSRTPVANDTITVYYSNETLYEGETATIEYNTDLHNSGLIILKDCREAISVNYNLQLLTSSDQFVTSPYFFQQGKNTIKVVLLSEEVNKLSNGYINNNAIITPKNTSGGTMSREFTPTITGITATNGYGNTATIYYYVDLGTTLAQVNEHHFDGTSGYQQVKSIVVTCSITNEENLELAILNKSKFVLARNIPADTTKENAIANWYFGTPQKSIFTNKQ